MPHNIHRELGECKGQFVKEREKEKVVNFMARIDGKRGQRRKMSDPESETCVPTKKSKLTEMEGCRMVNVPKVAKDLWCKRCDNSISLHYVVHEQQHGVASKLHVQCHHCADIVQVETGEKKSKFDDTNLKLAVGMLDAGIGETKVNTVMSAINIPTVSATAMKRYERRVGQALETLALSSCEEALIEEKALTIEMMM
ncbi:hypothetical protein QAD02_001981 [Eretmocerus hayati]|uniref:Uncharacterized protein n=1 Tax=Eretmocerus hayati TaxID=131215 RepID=A0ACC2NKG6_9HYME|nr:hypothetical protein QAD02_001981 [Eretmocerus hayati]